jgi:hypothetical protein
MPSDEPTHGTSPRGLSACFPTDAFVAAWAQTPRDTCHANEHATPLRGVRQRVLLRYALIKPPEEHSTPGSLKAVQVSLVKPVAYLKDRVRARNLRPTAPRPIRRKKAKVRSSGVVCLLTSGGLIRVRRRLDQQDVGFIASDPGFCRRPTDETATSLRANVTPALNGGRRRLVRDLGDGGGPYGWGSRGARRPRPAHNARRTCTQTSG